MSCRKLGERELKNMGQIWALTSPFHRTTYQKAMTFSPHCSTLQALGHCPSLTGSSLCCSKLPLLIHLVPVFPALISLQPPPYFFISHNCWLRASSTHNSSAPWRAQTCLPPIYPHRGWFPGLAVIIGPPSHSVHSPFQGHTWLSPVLTPPTHCCTQISGLGWEALSCCTFPGQSASLQDEDATLTLAKLLKELVSKCLDSALSLAVSFLLKSRSVLMYLFCSHSLKNSSRTQPHLSHRLLVSFMLTFSCVY